MLQNFSLQTEDILQGGTADVSNTTSSMVPTPDPDGAVPRSVRLAYAIVLTLLGVIICSGNGLFIVAYIKSTKQSSLRTNAIFFLVQLAVADFLVGLSMPYHIATFWISQLEHQMVTCALRYMTIMFPMSASLFCLLLASIDRCIAVRKPLKYQSIMTDGNVWIASGMAWATSFFIGVVLPLALHKKWRRSSAGLRCDLTVRFRWEYFGAIMLPLLLGLTVSLAGLYSVVIYTVIRHSRNRKNLSESTTLDTTHSFSSQNVRVLATGLIVCGIFYLCWLPFLLILMAQTYSFRMEDGTLGRARTIATFPAIANSFMNVLIYAWRLPLFRTFMKELLSIRGMTGRSEQNTSFSDLPASELRPRGP